MQQQNFRDCPKLVLAGCFGSRIPLTSVEWSNGGLWELGDKPLRLSIYLFGFRFVPLRDEYLSTHCLCSGVSGTEQPLDSRIALKAESTDSPF